MSDTINVWGLDVPVSALSLSELEYLKGLPSSLPSLEWVWSELDRVWEEIGMDNNKPLSLQQTSDYYSHPVWLMNGFFTALDPLSVQHRESIASYISTLNVSTVADYGGGFGELALQITKRCPNTKISVIEPFPSKLGIQRLKNNTHILYLPALKKDYDVIIAQDVLEHVEDPVGLAYSINSSLRPGGISIFANAFYPVIKCHLPTNFYLRNSFIYVMKAMGMGFIGAVIGAPHALIFQRRKMLNFPLARLTEYFLKTSFFFEANLRKYYSILKRVVFK